MMKNRKSLSRKSETSRSRAQFNRSDFSSESSKLGTVITKSKSCLKASQKDFGKFSAKSKNLNINGKASARTICHVSQKN